MKKLVIATALVLVSSSAFCIGRPHNVFATHKAISARTFVSSSKPKPGSLKVALNQEQSKAALSGISMVQRVAYLLLDLIR
jgi:hypothetical protein